MWVSCTYFQWAYNKPLSFAQYRSFLSRLVCLSRCEGLWVLQYSAFLAALVIAGIVAVVWCRQNASSVKLTSDGITARMPSRSLRILVETPLRLPVWVAEWEEVMIFLLAGVEELPHSRPVLYQQISDWLMQLYLHLSAVRSAVSIETPFQDSWSGGQQGCWQRSVDHHHSMPNGHLWLCGTQGWGGMVFCSHKSELPHGDFVVECFNSLLLANNGPVEHKSLVVIYTYIINLLGFLWKGKAPTVSTLKCV